MTESPAHESLTAESLIRDLERRRGARCPACGGPVCHHQALMSIAMGFKDAVRCLPCLAAVLGNPPRALREQLCQYVQRRDCFRAAWEWACQDEGVELADVPSCLPADGPPDAPATLAANEPSAPPPTESPSPHSDAPRPLPHALWDAGDLGCGELVLELRLRLQALQPGEVFQLTARDPGAREDMPAWCRLTGHTLLRGAHPDYWIQRKA